MKLGPPGRMALFGRLADAVLAADSAGRVVLCNPAAEALFGISASEALGRPAADLLPDPHHPEQAAGLLGGPTARPVRATGRDRQGRSFPVEVTVTRLPEDGDGAVAVLRDLRGRSADNSRLRLQGAAMAAAANAIFITDGEGRIEWVNDAFTRLSGYRSDEVIGRRPSILRSGVQTAAVYEELWRTIAAGSVWRGELVEKRKDGSLYTVEQTVTPMRDGGGRVSHFVVVHEDVTERKAAEERVRFLSLYDPLTSLPNRRLFTERLVQAVARAAAENKRLAVLYLDLDRFGRLNDTLGREVGDQTLSAVVERLVRAAPAAHLLARVGGDEFALIIADVVQVEDVAMTARRIIEEVTRPYEIAGHDVALGASIGIAMHPGDGDDAEQLSKCAELAMYRAVRESPNGFRFFSPEMDAEARLRLAFERDLRKALRKHEFTVHYQPQLCLRTGRIVALEALVRWRHDERGMVPPDRFVPVAEDEGLIGAIGAWVLREAVAQQARWRAEGVPLVPVAVNVSALQLRQHDLPGEVRRVLEEAGVDPSWIELELTETAVMENAERAVDVLAAIQRGGVNLAIDDFGTGYSSLNYLKRFPVSKLKIDKSFLHELSVDPSDAAITRGIVGLGHSLGLKVVAEGVETDAQLEFLREIGCDLGQGYLFSQPLPPGEAAALLGCQPFRRQGAP